MYPQFIQKWIATERMESSGAGRIAGRKAFERYQLMFYR